MPSDKTWRSAMAESASRRRFSSSVAVAGGVIMGSTKTRNARFRGAAGGRGRPASEATNIR